MTTATHPAESLEFLSRLHDGELSAAEREAFDAHRLECGECREAAAAFERSLTEFRAAPAPPVPTDLSARILRKIRAQSPSRRPFGVTFGIDIRWAGLFAAALLVAIIVPALLERRETRTAASAPPSPLTAYVVEAEADKRDRAAAEPKSPARQAPKAAESAKTLARERAEKEKASDALASASPEPPPPAAAPAPEAAAGAAAPRPQLEAGTRNAAPSLSARRSAAAAAPTEAAGGEVGSFAKEEAQAENVSLDVRSLDSDGRAPALLHSPPPDRLAPLRGREFVVIVEAQGSVQAVLPARREDEAQSLEKDAAASAGESDAPLRELRFRPTGKPRRLLVRVR